MKIIIMFFINLNTFIVNIDTASIFSLTLSYIETVGSDKNFPLVISTLWWSSTCKYNISDMTYSDVTYET